MGPIGLGPVGPYFLLRLPNTFVILGAHGVVSLRRRGHNGVEGASYAKWEGTWR